MDRPQTNRLLDALSPEDREAVLSQSKPVVLSIRASLQAQEEAPRYAYFVTSGFASVVVGHFDGASSETALIASEGVTGALSLLGSALPIADCFMQLAGTAHQIPHATLRELFLASPGIRTRILECVQQQAMTTMQVAACNATHDAVPRLARWLLMVRDRIQSDKFQITQEFLSQMLGARRTTVALAAGTLQRGGFIEYSRGKIAIHAGLEEAACDCYPVTRRLLQDLYR